jgi:hypothetical protein
MQTRGLMADGKTGSGVELSDRQLRTSVEKSADPATHDKSETK